MITRFSHFFLILGLLASLGGRASAVLTLEAANVATSNASNYLLTAESLSIDPAADREGVNVELTLQLFNASFISSDSAEIEATFSLQEQGGPAVDLEITPPASEVQVTETYTQGSRVRRLVTMFAALPPATQLDPSKNYRVVVNLRGRPPGGAWSSSNAYYSGYRKWVHFTNTDTNDASINTKVFASNLAMSNAIAIASTPENETFRATIETTLHRYDLETAPSPAAQIPVTYAMRLINTTTLSEVPLATPSITINQNLAATDAGVPPSPTSITWQQTLHLAPAAGEVLDPMANYYLEVTPTAAEPDTTPIPAVPSTATTPATRLLALSGNLWFGGVVTSFGQLANDPLMLISEAGGVYTTQLAVANQSGTAAALPIRHYGDGTPLNVTYDPATGDATVTAGTQAFSTVDTDIVVVSGLRLVRGTMQLNPTGALLQGGGILFPAGFGVSTNQNARRHTPGLSFVNEPLNPDFSLPFNTKTFTPLAGQYFYAFCDRLPLRFRTDAIIWNVAAGTFHYSQVASNDPADPAEVVLTRTFQELELKALTALLADPTEAERPSNDAYLVSLLSQSPVTIGLGAQGEALLSAAFDLGSGAMTTHYPQGVTLYWSNGRFNITQNEIVGPNYLANVAQTAITHKRDCTGGCGNNFGEGQFAFTATNNEWAITKDGGLRAEGSLTPQRLQWGSTELHPMEPPPPGGGPVFAHDTSQWSSGAVHIAGNWLGGTEVLDVTEPQRPQTILLSGSLPTGSYERPGTDSYLDGFADYAGLNLRVGTEGAITAKSVLAGRFTGTYDLKARSKYYVRKSGVTGIHEATQIIPSGLVMYDFAVNMDGLRLAYRDGLNVESKTGGSLYVPSPVSGLPGFDLNFKELEFLCRGQPGKMQLATQGETKSLAYWGTDIKPLSMEFAQPITAGCVSATEGFLLVSVQTRFPSITPQKLHASLGFQGNGNLVTKANPLSAGRDTDSRFVLPPTLEFVGHGGVPWEVTVTGAGYLSNPLPLAPSPGFSAPTQGFLNFPGTLNVPWFEDMKVHFQVSASSAANADSQIHLMGGWPANPADGNGTGWQVNNTTFFNNKHFDADNIGFPGATVAAYRDPGTAAFNPRAQKRWLGVVDFDFPLIWNGSQRRFHSEEQVAPLVVLGNVDRQVQALTPSAAEITFGVQLDVPRINSQALVAAVKEGLSGAIADALTQAIGGPLKDQLANGINKLDGLLTERITEALEVPIGMAVDPLIDTIILPGQTAVSQVATLKANLTTLPDLGLLNDIDARLASGEQGVDALLAMLTAAPDGSRNLIKNLVKELAKRAGVPGAENLLGDEMDTAMSEILADIEPDLAQAEELLQRVKSAITAVRTRLIAQVYAVFNQSSAAINAATDAAVAEIDTIFTPEARALFAPGVQRDRIRRIIIEKIMACAMVPQLQYVIRQNLQDVNQTFRTAIDDVLGQVNTLVREVIAETVGGLTDSRSDAVGEMGPASGGSGKLAGINIEGYAQINDESLRVLDINGEFEFNIPDSLKVQAHLRIEEFDANTPATGCRPAGAATAVVQLDAKAACDWIGSKGTTVAVGTKFSLQNGIPIGLDGYFDLQGSIKLGPIVVNEARFVAGFGGYTGPNAKSWAYLGGKIRGRFEAYEAAVGIFVGRTCDVKVVEMIDADVGQALTKANVGAGGPVTGVYFYGEAWIPINEVFGIPSTCLFTVRAGAGAGFFAFVGDDSSAYIGCKQFFGVEGTLLCIMSIRGEMHILGAVSIPGEPAPATGAGPENGLYKRANDPNIPPGVAFILKGRGEFSAELGVCPFCIELSKSVGLTWTIGGNEPGMEIDF